ncbi:hypothetical protein [Flavobacterium caeni]|uniref:Uncharacterized protein n=1 Tax=Flavobacterium caeni TaxID=490189 RepID=A0A1G5GX09_9FLAO|nr:hypothetical protein [Flavobacterium caeni]SCY56155.1 hypothetical protein SAMN02927903_01668 [Flavobacterium caeni]
MRNILFAVLVGALFSCSSDNDNMQIPIVQPPDQENYFVKFKLNGEPIELSDITYASMDMAFTEGTQTCYFGGGFYDPSQVESMSFRTYTYGAVATGVEYNSDHIFAPTTLPETYGVYKNADGKTFTSAANSLSIYPFRLTLTSRTDTEIQGTFEGTYKSTSDSETIEITEGSFKIDTTSWP